MRVAPLVFLVARAAVAVCPMETLYHTPSDPWVYVSAIAADDRFINVTHEIAVRQFVIRRIDRTTGASADVITLNTVVREIVSAPPFLIFKTEHFVDSSPGRPHIVINALGPDGVRDVAESDDYPGHENFVQLRSDGEFLYWFVVPTFDATASPIVYRRDGEIRRVLLSGGEVETIASALPLQRDLAISGNELLLVNDDGLARLPKSGGIPVIIDPDRDVQSISRVDPSGIWVTAIAPGEGLNGTDRVEVRRVSWTGRPIEILGSASFPRSVRSVKSVVDGNRAIVSVSGIFPRLAGVFGGLYVAESGAMVTFMTRPVWPLPIDIWGGFLYALLPDSLTTGQRSVVRLCIAPTRGRVIARH